jgi:uncharacterized protein YjbI with pentapeptide repeats
MAEAKALMLDREEILAATRQGKALTGVQIGHVDLSGANLRGGQFMGCTFAGTNLEGADLKGANLSGSDLRAANLRYANLFHCSVYKAVFPDEFSPEELLLSLKEGTRLRPNPLLTLFRKQGNKADLPPIEEEE